MTTRIAVNILVVFALAAVVAAVPGGGTAASVVSHAVYIIFLAALAWFASIMYRQHRFTLYSLGDRRRAALYIAIGVAALTLTARDRMWSSSAGSVAWLVLLGASIYTVAAVFLAARRG